MPAKKYIVSRNWRRNGTWLKIHHRLRDWSRIEMNATRVRSVAIIDSQNMKTAAIVHHDVGYDAGKPIRENGFWQLISFYLN
jgi:hypothetical protein